MENALKTILLVVNGRAGSGKNGANTFRIIKNFAAHGIKTTVCPIADGVTMEMEDYLQENSYDAVVCVGGDGTVNSAVNKLMKMEDRPILGYIPAGTTNDFSKNLKLVKDVDGACDLIVKGHCVNYDIGCFNNRFFNYVAAFGAFSAISYNTDQKAKNAFGYAAYILNAIASAPEHLTTKCHLSITADSESFVGDYIFGAIANSLSVGGMKLGSITSSNLYDGEFELFLIKSPTNASDITEILYSLMQSDFTNPHFIFKKVKHVHINTEEHVEWTLDGEYGGNPTEIDFDIFPGAIRIMTGLEQ